MTLEDGVELTDPPKGVSMHSYAGQGVGPGAQRCLLEQLPFLLSTTAVDPKVVEMPRLSDEGWDMYARSPSTTRRFGANGKEREDRNLRVTFGL